MEPIIGGKAAKAVRAAASPEARQKAQPSKFDKLRSELLDRLAEKAKVPSQAQIPPETQQALSNDLERRLAQSGPESVRTNLRVERMRAEDALASTKAAVAEIPNRPAFQPIHDRLRQIESQFERSGRLLKTAGGSDDPAKLLQVQMELYEMSRNIEVLSKVVDQVNSGIKTILQMQV